MPEKVKVKDLRKMGRDDLIKMLSDLRSEMVRLETERGRGVVDNPGRIKYVRRMIARILTILHEGELNDIKSKAPEMLKKGAKYTDVANQFKIPVSKVKRIIKASRGE